MAGEKKRKKRKKASDEKIEVRRVGCSLNRPSWQVDSLAGKCRGRQQGAKLARQGSAESSKAS